MSIALLHSDEQLVAIAKPAGLLVHRSLIDRRETAFALQLTRDLIGRRVYPVHRLDRPTSGVLLFALDPRTAAQLSAQFTARAVDKTYLALVRGWIEAPLSVDHPLREQLDRIADARADPAKAAQPARTEVEPLARCTLPLAIGRYPSARYSWVALRPSSGRKHQLRRHLKHIAHPIVGDTCHGDGRHNAALRQHIGCHRLMLHASELRLAHPRDGRPLRLCAPLPTDLLEPLRALATLAARDATAQGHWPTMPGDSGDCTR